ncbi:MAG: YbaN family protein [Planctomycetes bacterium]|nr:YbaN family protein [Planctomycetota bacterium]
MGQTGGAVRALYFSAAALSLTLGFVGLFLPLLPTTPFVLLSSWCLVRSSPELHARLRASRVFGPMLDDWERHRGVRLHTKLSAIGVLGCAVAASLWIGHLEPWHEVLLISTSALGAVLIARLPAVPRA